MRSFSRQLDLKHLLSFPDNTIEIGTHSYQTSYYLQPWTIEGGAAATAASTTPSIAATVPSATYAVPS